MPYFDTATYNNLIGILSEVGDDYVAEFANLFTQDGDYYVVKDLNDYYNFLSTLFEGETPDSDWTAWSGEITGKSTDWSGGN